MTGHDEHEDDDNDDLRINLCGVLRPHDNVRNASKCTMTEIEDLLTRVSFISRENKIKN